MTGDKIKALRVALGLTMQEFGNICQLSKVSIHNFESGKRMPNMPSLTKIINGFDLNPNIFFNNRLSLTSNDLSLIMDNMKTKTKQKISKEAKR